MHRESDIKKHDIGIVPQALNNASVTGKYFDMGLYRTAVANLSVGAMAASTTVTLELLQAQDSAGTNAKAIPPPPATELATVQITANTNVTEATLTLSSTDPGDAVTINGTTFTAVASGAAGHQFNVGASDTATAANLATAINAANIDIAAIGNADVVTLAAASSDDNILITVTNPAASITPATTKAWALIDLCASQLDIANGFTYVAAKVTTTADTAVAVVLKRAGYRIIETITVTRTGGQISSLVKVAGDKTVTYTVNRINGQISSISEAVI